MADYSQSGRPMVLTTPLGADVLLITDLEGREAISTPFSYRLRMLSTNYEVAGADLLNQAVNIRIQRTGGDRYVHGFVRRFALVGHEDDVAIYEAEIVPWLWFASLRRDCRIFQDMSVLEIVEKVLSDAEHQDFDVRCTRSYDKREYCVQYRESDLDFVSRLLEEEGMFFNFEHSESGHTMVITDTNANLADPLEPTVSYRRGRAPNFGMLEDDGGINELVREDSVHVGKVTLSDYDHLQPSLTLRRSIDGDGIGEIYDYPGHYTQLADGERYARIRLEAEEARRLVIRGSGDTRSLHAGGTMTVEQHLPAINGRYLLLEVALDARQSGYRANEDEGFRFKSRYTAIPFATPYRAPAITPRPVVRGTQTALVVGKSGEEIWVDSHGRVKVQFYWDREGAKDESSSCWVRVSSIWAGKGWGAVHLPRIGQEVIVDFLEGNPDRPIITGRVYNAEQTPPYSLPEHQTQSGIKSRSSKDGSSSNFNEIRMEDAKGKELLYIHAERNEHVVVEANRTLDVGHDETTTIGNNRKKIVKANETTEIAANRTEDVGGNETIAISGSRDERVGGMERIEISGLRMATVKSTEILKVEGSQIGQIDGHQVQKVGGNQGEMIAANRVKKVDGSDLLKVGAIKMVKAGGPIVIKSDAGIKLKVGGSEISITPAGIKIKSAQVKIEGIATVKVKGNLVDVKAAAILKAKAGGIGQIKADGLMQIQGGITMIN